MLYPQREIENFLLVDAVIGLSNVRNHLERTLDPLGGDVVLRSDSVVLIIAILKRIEKDAEKLLFLCDDPGAGQNGLERSHQMIRAEAA